MLVESINNYIDMHALSLGFYYKHDKNLISRCEYSSVSFLCLRNMKQGFFVEITQQM